MSTKSASAKVKAKEAKLDKKVVTNKVAEVKQSNAFKSIYQYPEGMSKEDKKAFRRRARAKKARLEKALTAAKPAEKAVAEKELASFRKETYAS